MTRDESMGAVGGRFRLPGRVVSALSGLVVLVLSFMAPLEPPGSVGYEPALPSRDPLFLVPIILVAACAGLTVGLLRRRLWPLSVLAVIGWLGFSMWVLPVVATFLAAATLRRRGVLIGYAAAAITVTAGPMVVNAMVGDSGLFEVVGIPATFTVLPLVGGLWARAHWQVLSGLRERASTLEREQVVRAERVRTEERTRIAREMHDVLAHRVSLMVLYAGALEVNARDERTAEGAALIRTTGREALAELRQLLGILRSPGQHDDELLLGPQPVLADLDRLLDQSRAAGMSVDRHDEGDARVLPLWVEHAAYRVVREALTNVHKHADDAPAHVVLHFLPDILEVTVTNGPAVRPGAAIPGSGLGLLGLRERIELLGGKLETGRPAGGGFTVTARIPTMGLHAEVPA